MSTALAERPAISSDELDLVRKTVANGATDAELKLFLFDCQRRGVHPLDKLLHFTKRGGRYTPVTSIDFMRSQAAMTGEMAGSDEPIFSPRQVEAGKYPIEATVTVYRLTQGQRFAYTATARWAEYCPDNAPMWKRMPHTMLGKCAEALALRKAFPQQLAGLYAREEMDQADKGGYVVEAPQIAAPERGEAGDTTLLSSRPRPPATAIPQSDVRPADERAEDDANGFHLGAATPTNALTLKSVERRPTRNANVTRFVIVLSDGREVATIREQLGTLAEQICQDGDPVTVETKAGKFGEDLTAIARVERVIQLHGDKDDHTGPVDLKDVPF